MKLKQNISDQTNDTELLSPFMERLRQDGNGFKVPDGYFDSLSPRIVDEIKKQENRSISRAIIPQYRKPLVWRSIMAVMVFAAMIISFILVKKDSTVLPATDEWTELNMAYDASYAEEALLAESNTIETELASSEINNKELISFTQKEPTIDEITEYLKEHETNTDILNEY